MNYVEDDHPEVATPEKTDTPAPAVNPAAEGEEAAELDNAGQETDPEDDENETPHGAKFTPEQQKVFDRAQARKTKKIHEARERAEAAERELETLKAENTALNAKVGDDAVLSAMQAAGVLPEYVTADEAKIVGESEKLKSSKRFLKALVRKGEDYTGIDSHGNERTWSLEQLEAQLDQTEERLETVGGRAAAIRQRIVEEYREDCKAGREARKKGGKGGAPATPARPAPKVSAVVPPAVPAGGGARRSDPTRDGAAAVDWSKVNTPEEMEQALLAEERAKQRR
jgi:hypothetical protein